MRRLKIKIFVKIINLISRKSRKRFGKYIFNNIGAIILMFFA